MNLTDGKNIFFNFTDNKNEVDNFNMKYVLLSLPAHIFFFSNRFSNIIND